MYVLMYEKEIGMKITRNKITPVINPNYQVKEAPQELIKILINSGTIPVVTTSLDKLCDDNISFSVNEDDVIGYVTFSCYEPTLEDNGFIYADISWCKDDYKDYQWANCEFEVDCNMNITRFICVQYEMVD